VLEFHPLLPFSVFTRRTRSCFISPVVALMLQVHSMFNRRFLACFPCGWAFLTVVASAVAGGFLAVAGAEWLARPHVARMAQAQPQPPCDARFTPLGQSYLPELAQAYAGAWNEGASALESGQPISAALDLVGKTWTSNRTALFDKLIAPAFAKVVPESIRDSDVTPQERAALAAAWRGFAAGLLR
jgi:hypothetical protein